MRATSRLADVTLQGAIDEGRINPPQEIKPSASPARRKAVTASSKTGGSIKNFIRDHVLSADGERVEMKALMRGYRAWCAQRSVAPVDLNAFLDEIEKLCRTLASRSRSATISAYIASM